VRAVSEVIVAGPIAIINANQARSIFKSTIVLSVNRKSLHRTQLSVYQYQTRQHLKAAITIQSCITITESYGYQLSGKELQTELDDMTCQKFCTGNGIEVQCGKRNRW
jgi:hypothetical protein